MVRGNKGAGDKAEDHRSGGFGRHRNLPPIKTVRPEDATERDDSQKGGGKVSDTSGDSAAGATAADRAREKHYGIND